MATLLSKKTYGQVVRNLDHYRKQDEEDRQENPTALPIDWRSSLAQMIENTVRDNHERCYKGLADQVLEYLAGKGLLIPYHGGYAFPGKELPSQEEIKKRAEETLSSLFPKDTP